MNSTEFILETQQDSLIYKPKNDEFFVKTDRGYVAYLQVTDYPTDTDIYWLNDLLDPNIQLKIGFSTEERAESLKNISESILEYRTQHKYVTEGTAILNSQDHLEELARVFHSVKKDKEPICNVFILIKVFDTDPNSLLDKCKELMETAKGNEFELAFRLFKNNENVSFDTYTNHKTIPYYYGKQMPLSSFTKGLVFIEQSIIDNTPYAKFKGFSKNGGIVVLDTRRRTTRKRLSYDKVMIGKMGAGKSTAAKLEVIDNYLDDIVSFIIDGENEFTGITNYLDGTNINIFENKINPLEIFDNKWQLHLSRLRTFLNILLSNEDIKFFFSIIVALYEEKGFNKNSSVDDLVSRNPKDYPTFSEVLDSIKDMLYIEDDEGNLVIDRSLTDMEQNHLKNAELIAEMFVTGEYSVFDGHSNIEINERITRFDVADVMESSDEMKLAVYYNILNFYWRYAQQNRVKGVLNPKKLNLIIDEAHNLFKIKLLSILQRLETMVRRGRKHLSGLTLISHKLTDFDGEGNPEIQKVIKTIFSLVQYKFIMQTDEEDVQLMNSVLGLSISEQNIVRAFNEQGDCLLCTGESNIAFRYYLPPTYEKIIDGSLLDDEIYD